MRLVELRLDAVDGYEVGQELKVDILAAGDKVDVTAVSQGKGFAGAMKRHNFRDRAPATATTRSTGLRARSAPLLPGPCVQGTKMAGRMGAEQVTTLNLEVVQADAERDLLLVKGSVPGPRGGVVIVRDAVKADEKEADDGQRHGEERRRRRHGHRRARRRRVRHRAQCARDAPGGHGPAGAPPGRDQSTKTRAEVRGGGRKPFRQKGTGNARQGSTRAPHFAGGGVALGPKPRNYAQRTPKKMIRLALRSALSDRAAEGKVVVVDAWGIETPRTKKGKAALDALGVEGQALVVVEPGPRRGRL